MRFAKYWIRDSAPEAGGAFLAWGWSNTSADEARAMAIQRSRSIRQWFDNDQLRRYPYAEADRPLREEVLETMLSPESGRPEAILTRNSYGVTVLNASRVLFADLDVEPNATPPTEGLWSRLFGSPRTAPAKDPVQQVGLFAKAHPNIGIRLYQTFAGYRAVLLNAVYDPMESPARQILAELDSDPLYIRLCQSQQCFRARLTPKPWRCGIPAPTISYPYAAADARTMQVWLSQYGQRAAAFTTCRITGHFGPQDLHPEVARILTVHDRYATGNSSLPLA